MNIKEILEELERYIEYAQLKNTKYSNASVGWQIDHILEVILLSITGLRISKPKKYKWKFNIKRFMVLTTNFIPRAKVRIPKFLKSDNDVNEEKLREKLNQAIQQLSNIDELTAKHYIKHPYFGMLNLKSTKKLLKVHSYHHLKIIREIVSAKS